MDAKQNRRIEEKMMVSAISRSSRKEIRLFSRNIKVILKEEFPALKSLVPSGKVVISSGATVRVNFTVINVGQDGEFTFKVSRLLNMSVILSSNFSLISSQFSPVRK